ncbi:MAG: hypothetical protein MI923_16985, partial [Phycisphaerales bacterium]|nr:hypothetical protein [Phycisphaerales bacterium]
KSYAVNYANGVLRRQLGLQNLSQSIRGPMVYPKAALAMAWRKARLSEKRKFVPMIDFTIDPNAETRIADIPAFAK